MTKPFCVIDGSVLIHDERGLKLMREGGFTIEFLKVLQKSVGARQIEDATKCLFAPRCTTCGSEVKKLITQSKVYGELAVYPYECRDCRKKYKPMREVTEQSYGVFAKHCGYIPFYDNCFVEHDFQKPFLDYVASVIDRRQDRGALVYGPTGVGKSFLAKILNNELIKAKTKVEFYGCAELAHFLQKAASEFDYEFYGSLVNARILILDDFGTQKMTDFIRSKFFEILDSRYNRRAVTIITTNLSLEDLKAFDPRLYSRFMHSEWMRLFLFKNKDLRF